MDIKEYILLVGNNIFHIYAHNQNDAISTFDKACFKFKDTENEYYQNYWNDLNDLVLANQYTIIENTDFVGIRKIT